MSGFRSAFNFAANKVVDWRDRKKYGPREVQLADILTRLSTFPGGQDLLRRAQAMEVDISVVGRNDLKGALGHFEATGEKPVIQIATSDNAAAMTLYLWHELRHMLQHAANPDGMAMGGRLRDARTAHILGTMWEADAFTAETLTALKQKKSGHPEYFDAILAKPEPGAHQYIARFLQEKPYESFRDDASFSRALFTGLMLDGLLSYRVGYFDHLKQDIRNSKDIGEFRDKIAKSPSGGMVLGPELMAQYGTGFTQVSSRALATAFLRAQPFDEQSALLRVETMVRRADRMTDPEFQKAKQEIVSRLQDIWYKESNGYRGQEAEAASNRLHKAAEAETPAALSDLKPRRPAKPVKQDYSWMRRPQG